MKIAALLLCVIGCAVAEECVNGGCTSGVTTCGNGYTLTCVQNHCVCADNQGAHTCTSAADCHGGHHCQGSWECNNNGHCHCLHHHGGGGQGGK